MLFSKTHKRVFILGIILASVFFAPVVYAVETSSTTLNSLIAQKNAQLQSINDQIAKSQQELQATQDAKKTLTGEVGRLNSNIQQINLGINASKITIDKLGLQMQELEGTITTQKSDVQKKEEAVKEAVRQMQQQDNDSLLVTLLKNNTLSDSVSDLQSLQDINERLLADISALVDSQKKLSNSLDQASQTKQNKEVEYTNLSNKKIIADQLRLEKNQLLEQTKNKEKVYQSSLTQLQEQQQEIAAEIEKMEAELRSEINYKNLPESAPGFLAMPIAGARVTQTYGATSFAQRAYKSKWHNGLDFSAAVGTPIYAVADGVVASVDNQDKYCYKGAYGKYVAIRHYTGLTTLYGHLSLYVVSQGQQVKRGELIGYSGSTGYATGPHLHFTVYDSGTFRTGSSNYCGPKMPYGGDLDPRKYLAL